MRESDFGAISDDGAEGEGRRGVAGVVPDSSALVGLLFVLDVVVFRVAGVGTESSSQTVVERPSQRLGVRAPCSRSLDVKRT